ncbi:hypothetical protein D3C75_1199630 [compost metagenome]
MIHKTCLYWQVRLNPISAFHEFVFSIRGKSLIEPSFLKFVACDHAVKILVADFMHNGSLQLVPR